MAIITIASLFLPDQNVFAIYDTTRDGDPDNVRGIQILIQDDDHERTSIWLTRAQWGNIKAQILSSEGPNP